MPSVLMVLSSHVPGTICGELESGMHVKGGWYLEEFAHPYAVMKKAGYDITVCSIKGGDATPNVDPHSLADIEADAVKKGVWEDTVVQAILKDTKSITTYKGTDFDAFMLVGGFGVMWDFYPNTDIARIGQECYENNGIVGAVCHGPIGLANIKLNNGSFLVAGKKCAGFTDAEENMIGLAGHFPTYPAEAGGKNTCEGVLPALGGVFEKVDAWGKCVTVDDRLICGQNPASADGVGEAIVAAVAAR